MTILKASIGFTAQDFEVTPPYSATSRIVPISACALHDPTTRFLAFSSQARSRTVLKLKEGPNPQTQYFGKNDSMKRLILSWVPELAAPDCSGPSGAQFL